MVEVEVLLVDLVVSGTLRLHRMVREGIPVLLHLRVIMVIQVMVALQAP